MLEPQLHLSGLVCPSSWLSISPGFSPSLPSLSVAGAASGQRLPRDAVPTDVWGRHRGEGCKQE